MALTVIGVFENAVDAQQAVQELVSDGFSRSTIELSVQTDDSPNDSFGSNERQPDSGVGGFFSSLFGDSDEARRYSAVTQRGTWVSVQVQTNDEAEQAADILDANGAIDIDERAAHYSGAATGEVATSQTDTNGTDPAYPTMPQETQMIRVIEEDLQVGKREVERGGVRVRSRIIERPVEESLQLREEHVTIQRTPVNRLATVADLNAFEEGQIELVEHAEVAVVSKTANVVEEVSISKEVTEREEVIRDTVRRTDVDVQPIDAGTTLRVEDSSDTDGVTYATKE